MKKMEKLVALILTGVMALTLFTACGGGGGVTNVNYEEYAKSAIVAAANEMAPKGVTLMSTATYDEFAADLLQSVDADGKINGSNYNMVFDHGYTEPVDKDTLKAVFYYDLRKVITKSSNTSNAENLSDKKTLETLKQRDEFDPEKVKEAVYNDKKMFTEMVNLIWKTQPTASSFSIDTVTYDKIGSAAKINGSNCYGAYAASVVIEMTMKY